MEDQAAAHQPIAYTILQAAKVTGTSRSTIYKEIGAGQLSAVKRGRQTLILDHALREWINRLPAYRPSGASNQAA